MAEGCSASCCWKMLLEKGQGGRAHPAVGAAPDERPQPHISEGGGHGSLEGGDAARH